MMQLSPNQKRTLCEKIERILDEVHDQISPGNYNFFTRRFSDAVANGHLRESYSLIELIEFAKKTILACVNEHLPSDRSDQQVAKYQKFYDDNSAKIASLYDIYIEMGKDAEHMQELRRQQETDATIKQSAQMLSTILARLQEVEENQRKIFDLLSKIGAEKQTEKCDTGSPASPRRLTTFK